MTVALGASVHHKKAGLREVMVIAAERLHGVHIVMSLIHLAAVDTGWGRENMYGHGHYQSVPLAEG